MNPWIAAARPKTLVAGFIPVALGSALAKNHGFFQWGVFFSALLGALAIQVGTNYVNDASDFQKGADGKDRLGPPRMAAEGLLSPQALYWGAGFTFFLALLFGLYLISAAGLMILWIGLASIIFAIAYTAGPFPLAYLGLGDLFVLIFFGLVAVLGTYFSHALRINTEGFFIALATGFHGVTLIAINNLRDIPTDTRAGKKTLAVRMGDRASRWYYTLLLLLPYLCWFFFLDRLSWSSFLLPFLTLPLAAWNAKTCWEIKDRKEFNRLLGKSALLQLAFGAAVCCALVIPQ